MAIVKAVNIQPGSGSHAIWQLINLLIGSAGWSKIHDSDGTTVSTSGTQVTSGGTNVGGLNNPFAWVVLRMPDGGLYLSIQHGPYPSNANNEFRIKVSQQVPVGGSATRVPAAPDDALVACGGTDEEPTFIETVIWESDSSPGSGYWAHALAETTPPYRFVLFAYSDNTVTGYVQTCFFLDAVQDWTLTPGDSFKYVLRAAVSGPYGCTRNYLSTSDGVATPKTWLAKGTDGQGFVTTPMCTLNSDVDNVGSIVVTPGATAINPITGVYELLPVVYNRRRSAADGPRGFKGISSMWAWSPGGQYPDLIFPGDLFSANGTRDCIALNDLVLTLWDGDIPQGTGREPVTRAARLLSAPAPDSTRPVVGNFVPAAGTMITANTPLQFDVTDNQNQFSSIAIKLSFAGSAPWEIACDGPQFGPNYLGSTRTAIANGFRYVLNRASGWPSSPTVSVLAVDGSGNSVL